jgi:hypothetical protein
MQQLQQLNPEEEAELLEFQSLERKVVQAGADDSIYRGVLKQDPYADDLDDESDGLGDGLDEHQDPLDHEQSEPYVHDASEDHYVYEEAETWDDADKHSPAAQQDHVHPYQVDHQDDEGQDGAFEAPPRSSLVNKLFVQKQPNRKTVTPQRKSTPTRLKDTGASKSSTVVAATKGKEGGDGGKGKEGVDEGDALASKMAQLDQEIREFRKQNEMLDKLRQVHTRARAHTHTHAHTHHTHITHTHHTHKSHTHTSHTHITHTHITHTHTHTHTGAVKARRQATTSRDTAAAAKGTVY